MQFKSYLVCVQSCASRLDARRAICGNLSNKRAELKAQRLIQLKSSAPVFSFIIKGLFNSFRLRRPNMEAGYSQKMHLLSGEGAGPKPYENLPGQPSEDKQHPRHSERPLLFSNRTKTPSLQLYQPGGWLYEISSLVLAVVAVIMLICVLRAYENKPNPQWPLGISLNTIVSILSTVFRASLMLSVAHGLSQSGWIWFTQRPRPLSDICWYDSASRGPLGSVQLLWRLRLL